MSTEKLYTQKITNPLDELFNILPSDLDHEDYAVVTEGDIVKPASDLAAVPEKDAEDIAIDQKIDEEYDAAITAYNTQTAYTEMIEPRYAARNAEVAANYLSIALNAATVRARVKGDRKKAAQFIPFSNNTRPNGIVVASREDILNMISVDAETKKV